MDDPPKNFLWIVQSGEKISAAFIMTGFLAQTGEGIINSICLDNRAAVLTHIITCPRLKMMAPWLHS